MAKLSYKLSYYVFYVLVALILVVLGLFYLVGYTNPVGEYNEPQNTGALMLLMYGMFAVAVVITVIGAVAQFIGALRDNPKGAIQSLIGIIVLVVLLVVTYSIGSTDAVRVGDGSVYSNVTMLKVTDMLIYSTYVLFGAAAVLTLVNLSGIFKR